HLRWIAGHGDAAGLHDFQLLLRGALAARNDGARMPHALARRGGDAGDEADHGLSHVVLDPARGVLLVGAADLADHDDGIGVGVVVEHLHDVDVLQAVHRVAADADGRRLADAKLGELAHRLVGERARARDDAHAPLLVDVARHDADLDLARRDDARAVRADEERPAALLAHAVAHLDHVAHRDALGDADDEVEVGLHGLPDRRGGEGRRDVDHRRVHARLLLGLGDGGEDGNALEVLARLLRIHAGDVAVVAECVGAARARVELAGLAGDALRDDAGVLVDEDAHFFFPRLAPLDLAFFLTGFRVFAFVTAFFFLTAAAFFFLTAAAFFFLTATAFFFAGFAVFFAGFAFFFAGFVFFRAATTFCAAS